MREQDHRPEADEIVESARDGAVEAVLRRHGLADRRFHNEAVLHEVAGAVAAAVAEALRQSKS